MACALTQGFLVDCKTSTGGIVELYIGNYDPAMTITANPSGEITSITGTTVYRYEAVKQTSSTAEAIQVSVENGTVVYNPVIVFALNKQEQTKRNEIKLLAQAKLIIISKDQNGLYRLFGMANGMDLTEGGINSGLAFADRNGYDLTFSGFEPEPAPQVQAAAFSGIIG
jgi:hypothetical protein